MAEAEIKDPNAAGPDPLIGRTLSGRFTIVEQLGAGGMGRVYKAIQSPLDRIVAVKVLHPQYAGRDAGFVKRFVLEASLTSKLRHPNTVTVIDYGQTEDSVFFIAMEFLEGRTVADLIAKSGPFEWKRAVHIGQQVCRSLREAHKFGIIHRDLKPANVMLLDEADHDVVKVLDFGLVKSFVPDGTPLPEAEITQAGMLLGSPQYMAPEQARHQSDPRSDVYSFGILMFEMLAGKPPFQAKDYLEVIVKHLKEAPPSIRAVKPDAQLPDAVEAIVMRCLQKEPSARFQSMDDLLDALRNVAGMTGLSTNTETRSAAWTQQTPPPVPSARSGLVTPQPGAIRAGAPLTPAPAAPNSESGVRRSTMAPPPLFSSTAMAKAALEAPPSQTALFASAQTGGGSKSGWLMAGVAALLVGGGTAWVMLRSDRMPAVAPTPTAQAAPPPTPAPANPEPASGAKSVRFRVSSDPAGARVFTGARDLGVTPVVFELPAQADGTATAELIFVLDGYHPLAVTAGGSGDVVLSQKLQRKSGGGSGGSVSAVSSASTSVGRSGAASSNSGAPASFESRVEESQLLADPVAPARPVPAVLESAEPKRVAAPAVTSSAPAAVTSTATAPVASAPTPSTMPSKPLGSEVIPFGEGMTRPEQLVAGKPVEFTREALQARVEGLMIVKCVINTAGRLEKCRILKGLPYMEQPVLDSLYSRLYKPVTFQGKPVSVDYVFDVRVSVPRR